MFQAHASRCGACHELGRIRPVLIIFSHTKVKGCPIGLTTASVVSSRPAMELAFSPVVIHAGEKRALRAGSPAARHRYASPVRPIMAMNESKSGASGWTLSWRLMFVMSK